MSKIVGLGACVLDTLINCNKYPTEDTKLKADSIFLSGGGPVGNALVVISKLGVTAEVLGGFGDDASANYLISDFNRYGVLTDNVTVCRGASSFTSYIVLSEEAKTRTCVFDRGTVPDDVSNVKLSAVDTADIVHLDGNYLNCAISLAKYAKNKGVLVSLDAGGLYKDIDKLIPYVDVLIPSAEFALGFTGKTDIKSAILDLYSKYTPKVLVVTDGSNGGYYYEDGNILHYDSVKVNAVDTNGAGDTFHGAFLVALVNGKSIKDCCNYASAVAGYKVGFKGARTYPLTKQIADDLVK
ncbi:MAG: hypothetical protein J6B16_00215 [Clostridia bacterium]|nr:hypothetical protein [Clostridia bacterium]